MSLSPVQYTSLYQMNYLFLETIQGNLSNQVINDSLNPFLIDLKEAIQKDDVSLEAIKESTIEYFENILTLNDDSKDQIESIVNRIHGTTKDWGLDSPVIQDFYTNVLNEIIEE